MRFTLIFTVVVQHTNAQPLVGKWKMESVFIVSAFSNDIKRIKSTCIQKIRLALTSIHYIFCFENEKIRFSFHFEQIP